MPTAPCRRPLKPASISLLPGATKQFTAYGQNSLGDSVAVPVTFTATGGTITSSGLYTPGRTADTYRVVASAGGLADTSVTTITSSITSTGKVGQPFGPSQQLARTGSIRPPSRRRGVKNGTVVGANTMDEPCVYGGADGAGTPGAPRVP